MTIRPFKYLLQAVAVEQDDETGRFVRELPSEPIAVFNAEQAVQVIEKFEEEILAASNGKVGALDGQRGEA